MHTLPISTGWDQPCYVSLGWAHDKMHRLLEEDVCIETSWSAFPGRSEAAGASEVHPIAIIETAILTTG